MLSSVGLFIGSYFMYPSFDWVHDSFSMMGDAVKPSFYYFIIAFSLYYSAIALLGFLIAQRKWILIYSQISSMMLALTSYFHY